MCPKNLKYLEHDYSTKTQEYLEMAEIATKLWFILRGFGI